LGLPAKFGIEGFPVYKVVWTRGVSLYVYDKHDTIKKHSLKKKKIFNVINLHSSFGKNKLLKNKTILIIS